MKKITDLLKRRVYRHVQFLSETMWKKFEYTCITFMGLVISFIWLRVQNKAYFNSSSDMHFHFFCFWYIRTSLRLYGTIPTWNEYWWTGVPFLRLYSPISYYAVAGLSLFIFPGGNDLESVVLTFKLIVMLLVIFQGIFMVFMAKEFTKNKLIAFISGATYILTFYHWGELTIRGAFPNFFAITFLPLTLGLQEKAIKEKNDFFTICTGLCFASLILSQTFVAYHYSIFMIFHFLYKILDRRDQNLKVSEISVRFCIIFVIGILVSAFWFFPALYELKDFSYRSTGYGIPDEFFDKNMRLYLQRNFWQLKYHYIGNSILLLSFPSYLLYRRKEILFFNVLTIVFGLFVCFPVIIGVLPIPIYQEGWRFVDILVLSLSILSGATTAGVYRLIKKYLKVPHFRWLPLSKVFLIFVLVIIILDLYPGILTHSNDSIETIQRDYAEVYSYLQHMEDDFRVWEIPSWRTYHSPAYHYKGKIIGSKAMSTYYQRILLGSLRDYERDAKFSSSKDNMNMNLAGLLGLLNVKFVTVNEKYYDHMAFLDDLDDFCINREFDNFKIYENNRFLSKITLRENVILLVGDKEITFNIFQNLTKSSQNIIDNAILIRCPTRFLENLDINFLKNFKIIFIADARYEHEGNNFEVLSTFEKGGGLIIRNVASLESAMTRIKKESISHINLQKNKLGELIIRVENDKNSFLVVSETFHPNWKAYIDNTPVDIYEVEPFLMSIIVPPGVHEILFKLDNSSQRIGNIISEITLLVSIIYLLPVRSSQEKTRNAIRRQLRHLKNVIYRKK